MYALAQRVTRLEAKLDNGVAHRIEDIAGYVQTNTERLDNFILEIATWNSSS